MSCPKFSRIAVSGVVFESVSVSMLLSLWNLVSVLGSIVSANVACFFVHGICLHDNLTGNW